MRERTVKDAHLPAAFLTTALTMRHTHIRTGRGVTYSSSSLIRCLAIPDIQGRGANQPHVFGVFIHPAQWGKSMENTKYFERHNSFVYL